MRDDETGKRSLFGPPSNDSEHRDDESRRNFFSDRPTIGVDCARCGTSTRIAALDALARVLRFSLWIPGRVYSRRLLCPACDRRSWVRLRFL